MAEETLLTDEFLRQLINVGEVDIVVGLSTHNHAKTIGPVIGAIQAGILKCFPRERVAIINADGGSQDGTTELVKNASIDDLWRDSKVYALRTLHCISVRYARVPDPSRALQTILAGADLLRAKACVIVSPDSTTIQPDWIQRLARPAYSDNFDLVCPIYQRQQFEGALVRNLLYPMTRSIYGSRIREPYGSEFAISGRLVTDFLGNGIMNQDWARMGPEIALTILAITGKYRVCQSCLGARDHSTRNAHDMVGVMENGRGTVRLSGRQLFFLERGQRIRGGTDVGHASRAAAGDCPHQPEALVGNVCRRRGSAGAGSALDSLGILAFGTTAHCGSRAERFRVSGGIMDQDRL